jgi:ADP-heptose:LPS heptosyltransferase
VTLFKNIVVIRDGALGDVICLEPILSYLLKKDKRVILVSRFASIYKAKPSLKLVSQATRFQKAIWRILDFFSNGKYVLNLNNSYEQHPLSPLIMGYEIEANIRLDSKTVNPESFNRSSNQYFENPDKIILFHIQSPSQKISYRSVHGVDFKALANKLNEAGYSCVEIIQKSRDIKPILDDYISHDLMNLFGIISEAKYFVGLDSGPAHVAHIFGKKSFLFFGSVNPALRLNLSQLDGFIFQNSCPNAGCYHQTIGTTGTPCIFETESITPPCCTFETEKIFSTILQHLNKHI